jgi:hypothetical protein
VGRDVAQGGGRDRSALTRAVYLIIRFVTIKPVSGTLEAVLTSTSMSASMSPQILFKSGEVLTTLQ